MVIRLAARLLHSGTQLSKLAGDSFIICQLLTEPDERSRCPLTIPSVRKRTLGNPAMLNPASLVCIHRRGCWSLFPYQQNDFVESKGFVRSLNR